MATVEDLIEADRRMRPDLWERIDRIAEIVDPSAFAGERWDGVGPGAKRIADSPRVRYAQSAARTTAMQILQYLGLAPDTTDCLRAMEGGTDGG